MDAQRDGRLGDFLRANGLADDPRTEKVFGEVRLGLVYDLGGPPAKVQQTLG